MTALNLSIKCLFKHLHKKLAGGVEVQSWYTAFAWIVATIFLVGLTARDLWSMFSNFSSDPTSTEVSLKVMEASDFNPTLCLKLDPAALACPLIDVSNAEEVQSFLDQLIDIDVIVFIDLEVDEYININNRSSLSDSDIESLKHSRRKLVALITAMLWKLTESEYVNNNRDPMFYHWSEPGYFLAHRFHKQHNVSFVELSKTVGSYLCRLVDLQYMSYHWNGSQGIAVRINSSEACRKEYISWLGVGSIGYAKTYLCVQESLAGVFRYSTSMDFTHFTINTKALYDDSKLKRCTPQHAEQMRLEFDSNAALSEDSDSLLTIPYGQTYLGYVEIQAEYSAVDLKRRQCSQNQSRFDCRSQCRILAFIRHCGCLPLSYFKLHESVSERFKAVIPLCPDLPQSSPGTNHSDQLPQFVRPNCRKVSATFDCDPKCLKSCHRKCDFRKFGFDVRPFSHDGSTQLTLYVNNFTYPYFEERRVMEWANFISNLGGVIGLYVGASLLSLFTFIAIILENLVLSLWKQLRSLSVAAPDKNKQKKKSTDKGIDAHLATENISIEQLEQTKATTGCVSLDIKKNNLMSDKETNLVRAKSHSLKQVVTNSSPGNISEMISTMQKELEQIKSLSTDYQRGFNNDRLHPKTMRSPHTDENWWKLEMRKSSLC